MGMLVPPPLNHPEFEKIMAKRIRSLQIRGLILVVSLVLWALVSIAMLVW